jgi:phosphoribosyl-ATP pyrophosphohydrolase
MDDSLGRLYQQVIEAKRAIRPVANRQADASGRAKMAKKLAEEAIEVVIDAMNGDREAVVRESADLLYNLVVLWAEPASGRRTYSPKWPGASGCSAWPKSCRRSMSRPATPPQGGSARLPPAKAGGARPRRPRVDIPPRRR